MRRIHWNGDMSNDPCDGKIVATVGELMHIEWDDGRKQVIPEFIVSPRNGWSVSNG